MSEANSRCKAQTRCVGIKSRLVTAAVLLEQTLGPATFTLVCSATGNVVVGLVYTGSDATPRTGKSSLSVGLVFIEARGLIHYAACLPYMCCVFGILKKIDPVSEYLCVLNVIQRNWEQSV